MPKSYVGIYRRAQGISYNSSEYQINYYQNNKYKIQQNYHYKKNNKNENLYVGYESPKQYYKQKLIDEGYLIIIN